MTPNLHRRVAREIRPAPTGELERASVRKLHFVLRRARAAIVDDDLLRGRRGSTRRCAEIELVRSEFRRSSAGASASPFGVVTPSPVPPTSSGSCRPEIWPQAVTTRADTTSATRRLSRVRLQPVENSVPRPRVPSTSRSRRSRRPTFGHLGNPCVDQLSRDAERRRDHRKRVGARTTSRRRARRDRSRMSPTPTRR
jgi:hypothetical protein